MTPNYSRGEFERRWLRFELVAGLDVPMVLAKPVFREAERVEPLFNMDASWAAWWASTSKAPALDLGISTVWPQKTPPDDYFFPEVVSRGRKSHFVRLHVDASQIETVDEKDRHTLLVPAIGAALERLVTKLKLASPPARFPDGVAPRAP